MKYVSVGDGVTELSQIIFGCASVGGRVDEARSVRAMELAFDHGVSGFDIARSYGYGDAERIVGRFIRDKRNRCVVVSKAGIESVRVSPGWNAAKNMARQVFSVAPALRTLLQGPMGKAHVPGNFTGPAIVKSVEESLRQLATDRIDILFLHCPPSTVAEQDDVFESLETLKQAGKILRYGISSSVEELSSIEWPAVDAYQYPARTCWEGKGQWPGRMGLRFANRLFAGGGAGEQELLDLIGAEAMARFSSAERREVLLRGPIVAGYCDAAVVSMFTPEHLVANVNVFNSPTLDDRRLEALVETVHSRGNHVES